MNLKIKIRNIVGNHYEIGSKLGKSIANTFGNEYMSQRLDSMRESYLYSALGMKYKLDQLFVAESSHYLKEVLQKYHPYLLSEIEGFSNNINKPVETTLAFLLNYGNGIGCTHLFHNGIHAHNYDDHPRNVDMQLLSIHPESSYKSVGFSLGQIGRLDGINEKGLAVSLSWGGGQLCKDLKLSAELFIRFLLDKSSNLEEALDLFYHVGYGSPNNLLISDATNNAVVIENSGNKHKIRKLHPGQVLYSANSYMDKDMVNEQKFRNPTTSQRESFISQNILVETTVAEIKDLFTTPYPEGLFESYYEEELGTLWTVLFSPNELTATVLIGNQTNLKEKVINLNQLGERDMQSELSTNVHESRL